ncbi:MAG: hypothetical protein KC547_05885 [Anaerolineae bacterium]|nr:hypothetical protein [Anaerolineae bacterium]
MTQQMTSAEGFARLAAQADGLFCMVGGLIGALAAGSLSEWTGIKPVELLTFVAIGLIIYGAGLFGIASTRPVTRRLPLTGMTLNLAWIAMSIWLLLADPFPLTTEGRALVIAIAVIVDVFATWQFLAVRRMRGQNTTGHLLHKPI